MAGRITKYESFCGKATQQGIFDALQMGYFTHFAPRFSAIRSGQRIPS
jgi:hypothetical protein